jgi:PPOX class probable FMN-dependent enzyme
MELDSHASWQWRLTQSLDKAAVAGEGCFMQLANLDVEGNIQNRTLVCRDFDPSQDTLMFISDRRSDKYRELLASPQAQVCWYSGTRREQFRLTTVCRLIESSPENKVRLTHYWQQLSVATQSQFFWQAPGSEREPKPALTQLVQKQQSAPEHFILIECQVIAVDYLTLLANPQARIRYFKDTVGQWQLTHVYP